MKIWKVSRNDVGFVGDEEYYLNEKDAKKDFLERIESEKKKESYASDDDCEFYCEKNGVISKDGNNCMICFWVETNDENGIESDVHVMEIDIEQIEVKDNYEPLQTKGGGQR